MNQTRQAKLAESKFTRAESIRPRGIRLGVNVDHVATLRQARGGTTPYPDLYAHVLLAVKGGADSITIHLREDCRHIQPHDVQLLCRKAPVPINLEMAVTPDMVKTALRHQPTYACFVPEKRAELTTDGGLDVWKKKKSIAEAVAVLKRKNILVSTFIDPDILQVNASQAVGAWAVEFHTGRWVHLKGVAQKKEWQRLERAAKRAQELGLHVHAGHGLDYETTKKILTLPHLVEVNIGHSLVCYALTYGFEEAVRRMRGILDSCGKIVGGMS